MSHETQDFSELELIAQIESILKDPKLTKSLPPAPQENDYPEPYFGKSMPRLLFKKISKEQDEIIAALNKSNIEPKGLYIDKGIGKKRVFIQKDVPPVTFLSGHTLQPHSLEFISYDNPTVDSLNKVLPFEMNAKLTIYGIHNDVATVKQATELLENPHSGFSPQTSYIIHPERNMRRLFKISAIPHEFSDERQDLLPDVPSYQFVFSEYNTNDTDMLRTYYHFLSEKLQKK